MHVYVDRHGIKISNNNSLYIFNIHRITPFKLSQDFDCLI